MIIHLSEDVDYKMLDSLIKAFTELKVDEHMDIYFSSPEGGMVDVAEAMIDLINSHKERVNMIFYGECFSSGMHIMLRTSCSKRVLPDTRGMYHFSWQEMSIAEGGKPSNDYDRFSLKEMKASKNRTIDYLKITNLSEKEISGIKNGKDIYFTYDRLKEIIN